MKAVRSEASRPAAPAELEALRALIGGTARETVRLPLLSGSMGPALLPGDILAVRPESGRRVHVGDVAVFLRDGRPTAHRIIFALRLGGFSLLVEMGDANRLPSLLAQGAVLGVVEAVERRGTPVPFPGRSGGRSSGREARRKARRMFWRYFAGVFPKEFLKRSLGR